MDDAPASYWAIYPVVMVQLDAGGQIPTAAAPLAVRPRTEARSGKQVAVVPIHGVMLANQSPSPFAAMTGAVSTPSLASAIAALSADQSIAAIVLDVDSPGGSVGGVPELADAVASASARKPVVAVASGLMASAAYWVASQATEIVAQPSATVGSIGVVATHADYSKALEMRGVRITHITSATHKAEGSPDAPLSADAAAHIQAQVDYYHNLFTKAVARGRGVSVSDVRGDQFGRGRVYHAEAAVERRMVDRIGGGLDDVVGALLSGRWRSPKGARAEGDGLATRIDLTRRKLRMVAAIEGR